MRSKMCIKIVMKVRLKLLIAQLMRKITREP